MQHRPVRIHNTPGLVGVLSGNPIHPKALPSPNSTQVGALVRSAEVRHIIAGKFRDQGCLKRLCQIGSQRAFTSRFGAGDDYGALNGLCVCAVYMFINGFLWFKHPCCFYGHLPAFVQAFDGRFGHFCFERPLQLPVLGNIAAVFPKTGG
jgi:hypothetical protein